MLTTINGWHALALMLIAFGMPIAMAAVGDHRTRRRLARQEAARVQSIRERLYGPDVDALHRDAITSTFAAKPQEGAQS